MIVIVDCIDISIAFIASVKPIFISSFTTSSTSASSTAADDMSTNFFLTGDPARRSRGTYETKHVKNNSYYQRTLLFVSLGLHFSARTARILRDSYPLFLLLNMPTLYAVEMSTVTDVILGRVQEAIHGRKKVVRCMDPYTLLFDCQTSHFRCLATRVWPDWACYPFVLLYKWDGLRFSIITCKQPKGN